MGETKQLAINTFILYFRMIALMAVSFFTVRIVLNALGESDYGVFSVVGGLVATFTLFSNSLTTSSTRFHSYGIGLGSQQHLRNIFATNLTIHIVISLVILLIIETAGVWFLDNKMNIPDGSLKGANWVLQCTTISFIIGVAVVPYNSAIIAHEKMNAFAYLTFVDIAFKLFNALFIYFYVGNKLIAYAILTLISGITTQVFYIIYCKRHFCECHFSLIWDSALIKKVFSFSSWNFIGASSGVLRDQGVNILLNLFYGTIVNAARGIAMQVNGAVSSFVNNFMVALTPRIIKKYAKKEYNQACKLVFSGARMSYSLLLFLALPIILEAPLILKLWLGLVPEYTTVFVRLILIYSLTESVSHTMVTLMLATGNIRNYQILVGGCQCLNFPIAYLLLKMGMSPESPIVLAIIISICCLVLRLIMLRRVVNFPVRKFIIDVLLRMSLVTIVASLFPIIIFRFISDGIPGLIAVVTICICSTGLAVLFIGCKQNERRKIFSTIKYKISGFAH